MKKHLGGVSLRLGSALMAGSLVIGGAGRVAADETPVNTYTLDRQTDPSVAMDADGDFVITWESYGQSGGSTPMTDIYAQRFDSNGDPAGAEFAVYAASYDQRNPAAAMDDDGNFVIVFESGDFASNYQIWAWRYNSSGGFLGNQFITNDSISKQFPAIAMASGSGDFVVTWDSPDASVYGIYARRYKADGTPYDAIFPVNSTTAGNQTKSSIGMDNYSNFAVVWEGQGGQDGDGIGVFGQMYTSNGTPSGTEFQVNTTTAGNQTNPSVSMSWNGRCVAVWESSSSNGDLSTYDVYAQLINLNGTLAGEEFRVNTTTENYQGKPAVVMDAVGNILVAWSSQGQDGSLEGVYARRFDWDGNPLSDEFRVNTTTAGSQTSPAVAADLDTGSFVAAWQGPDASSDGIFMSWPLPVPEPGLLALDMAALATLASIGRRRPRH